MSSPIDVVLARLEKAKRTRPGSYIAKCPAHKDRRASLSLCEAADGRVLMHCFAGCETAAVVGAMALTFEDLFPPRPPSPGGGHAPVKRPFSAAELLDAMTVELRVIWILLTDISHGREVKAAERRRAAVARDRCLALMEELRLVR